MELEYRGERFRGIVEDVQADEKSSQFWLVTVVLATGAPALSKGDQVRWVDPGGLGVTVRRSATGVVPKIMLRWIGE